MLNDPSAPLNTVFLSPVSIPAGTSPGYAGTVTMTLSNAISLAGYQINTITNGVTTFDVDTIAPTLNALSQYTTPNGIVVPPHTPVSFVGPPMAPPYNKCKLRFSQGPLGVHEDISGNPSTINPAQFNFLISTVQRLVTNAIIDPVDGNVILTINQTMVQGENVGVKYYPNSSSDENLVDAAGNKVERIQGGGNTFVAIDNIIP